MENKDLIKNLERLGFKAEGEGDEKIWWLPGTQFTLYCRYDGTLTAPVCGCSVEVKDIFRLASLMAMCGVIDSYESFAYLMESMNARVLGSEA